MGKKLVNRLKIALGRQLSPKQMANAKEPEKFTIGGYSGGSMKVDKLGIYPSGEFVRFRQRFSHMTIPSASHRLKISHTNYYLSRAVVEVYDLKGCLKEKTVSRRNLYGRGDDTTRLFNPPGRLIGEREKK